MKIMMLALASVIGFSQCATANEPTDRLERTRRDLMRFTNDVDLIINGKTPNGLDCSAEIDIEEEVGNAITFDIFDSADRRITLIAAKEIPRGFEQRDVITLTKEASLKFIVRIRSISLRSGHAVAGEVVLKKQNPEGRVTEIQMTKGDLNITCISDE